MAHRKKTPDILGDLLSGPSLSPSAQEEKEHGRRNSKGSDLNEQRTKTSARRKVAKAVEHDEEYFETLLNRAASGLELVAEVLGHRRLVQWLDEMRSRFAVDEAIPKSSASLAFKRSVCAWAENHLGAQTATSPYQANGLTTKEPYEVDIWANFKGEGSQAGLDIWIQCRESDTPVKKKDISQLVERALDVYHAAHTDKQEFWFDRLIFVSSAPFEPGALEIAAKEGVACVYYDGTSYLFQTDENWKLKPNWLREAEAGRGKD